MEEYFGVVPCTVMSMMSERSDVERLRSGYLRRRRHARACSWPPKRPAPCSTGTTTTATIPTRPSASIAATCPSISSHDVRMDFQEIIAGTVGKENTFGTCVGRVKAGPMSYRALLHRRSRQARSAATSAKADSPTIRWKPSAAPASSRIPNLQKLLRYICENGFEHHVAANFSSVARRRVRSRHALPGMDRPCT